MTDDILPLGSLEMTQTIQQGEYYKSNSEFVDFL